jgi:hypothetical protein
MAGVLPSRRAKPRIETHSHADDSAFPGFGSRKMDRCIEVLTEDTNSASGCILPAIRASKIPKVLGSTATAAPAAPNAWLLPTCPSAMSRQGPERPTANWQVGRVSRRPLPRQGRYRDDTVELQTEP